MYAYVGNSAVGLTKRCELQFFRRHCEGHLCDERIGVGFSS